MCHAHGTDVAHDELPFQVQACSDFVAGLARRKQLRLDSVFDDGNPRRRELPMLHEVIFKSWGYDDEVAGVPVEERRNCAERAMKQRILASSTNRSKSLRPKVAHFEHKGNALPPCNPPSGHADQ